MLSKLTTGLTLASTDLTYYWPNSEIKWDLTLYTMEIRWKSLFRRTEIQPNLGGPVITHPERWDTAKDATRKKLLVLAELLVYN